MNNIKQIRKQQGLTITELSQKVGMSQANLTKIENNQIELRHEVAQKIATILNVSISSLTGTSDLNAIELINPEQFLMPQFTKWNIIPQIDTINTKGYIMPDDTMSPTITKDSICVVNTKETTIHNGLFLIQQNEQIKARRLQIISKDEFLILTDNKSYTQNQVNINTITIIGKITHIISSTCVK